MQKKSLKITTIHYDHTKNIGIFTVITLGNFLKTKKTFQEFLPISRKYETSTHAFNIKINE